jgi:hypothetical protein
MSDLYVLFRPQIPFNLYAHGDELDRVLSESVVFELDRIREEEDYVERSGLFSLEELRDLDRDTRYHLCGAYGELVRPIVEGLQWARFQARLHLPGTLFRFPPGWDKDLGGTRLQQNHCRFPTPGEQRFRDFLRTVD